MGMSTSHNNDSKHVLNIIWVLAIVLSILPVILFNPHNDPLL